MDHRQDAAYWLALLRIPGVGAAKALALLEHFETPRNLFECGPSVAAGLLGDAGLRYLRSPDWGVIDPELAWLEQPDNHIITLHDNTYPPLLREISDPPTLLYIRGDPTLLSSSQLAVVGSRNPSPSGPQTAAEFACVLADAGLTITSGLALGIDAASHRGALGIGGKTIAVLGTGVDRVYPAQHRELAHEIAHGGALVSEFPLGTPPRPDHFPRRNRIIAALSLGVLVVEANVNSGSLITARLAADYGREVFAIPGSIHSPVSRGCHALIRLGAKLVETAQDVFEELGAIAPCAAPQAYTSRSNAAPELDARCESLMECLGFDPTTVDTLVERTGLTPEVVSSMLLMLELRGHVVTTPSGLYSRLPTQGTLR